MSDTLVLWPIKRGSKYAVGYFKGADFIRISKYYNTETIMRIERNRLAALSPEKFVQISELKENTYGQSSAKAQDRS